MDKEQKKIWIGAMAGVIGTSMGAILITAMESDRAAMLYFFTYSIVAMLGFLYLTKE